MQITIVPIKAETVQVQPPQAYKKTRMRVAFERAALVIIVGPGVAVGIGMMVATMMVLLGMAR